VLVWSRSRIASGTLQPLPVDWQQRAADKAVKRSRKRSKKKRRR